MCSLSRVANCTLCLPFSSKEAILRHVQNIYGSLKVTLLQGQRYHIIVLLVCVYPKFTQFHFEGNCFQVQDHFETSVLLNDLKSDLKQYKIKVYV